MYKPVQGTYPFTYKGKPLKITFIKGETKLTTQARKIDSVKSIIFTSEDPNPQLIKDLISEALDGYGQSSEHDMIIYENSGGAWSKSKDKKSRTLDSVILESNITNIVIEDMK
jgi:chaperone BCS1